jgi:hypothetical protein
MRKILIGVVIVVALLVAGFFFLNRQSSYDRSFDTDVATPAYRENGPVVLYDEGHRNAHLTTTGYKPLADLIRNDGYTLDTAQGRLTAEQLRGASVLVIVLPRGENPTEDSSAYTESEGAAIGAWVRGGGSLLLITDHWPFGVATRPLAKRVEVDLGGGFVEDSKYHDAARGASHLIFSKENGLLKDHAITRDVERVLTFTGSSVQGPAGTVPFMLLSDSATERPPGPARFERSGGNERILMTYGDPRPAGGRGQGIAFELGRGRVVVLGEAGMLRAQKDRSGLVGMNVPGYDNRQLALNIMHWLSRLQARSH